MLMEHHFTPISGTICGSLIGLSAALLWHCNGRIVGISGIVGLILTRSSVAALSEGPRFGLRPRRRELPDPIEGHNRQTHPLLRSRGMAQPIQREIADLLQFGGVIDRLRGRPAQGRDAGGMTPSRPRRDPRRRCPKVRFYSMASKGRRPGRRRPSPDKACRQPVLQHQPVPLGSAVLSAAEVGLEPVTR